MWKNKVINIKDGSNNFSGSEFEDSFNTDNSFNTDSYNTYNYLTAINLQCPPVNPINNSNNRTMLKNMVGKQIQIWAYAVDEYCRFIDESTGEQMVRYTIINVHSSDNFIADHIQLNIPFDIYDEDIERKIIWTKRY